MFDYEGNYIRTFSSVKEAVKFLGLKSSSSLTNILRGSFKRNFVGGYRWAYTGETPKPHKIVRIHKDGKKYCFVDVFTASKELGFSRNDAKKYLKGIRGPIPGLRIEYDIV